VKQAAQLQNQPSPVFLKNSLTHSILGLQHTEWICLNKQKQLATNKNAINNSSEQMQFGIHVSQSGWQC